jgi:hypothetical protein
MKKLFCTLFALSCISATYAQLGVNSTGNPPIPSAQLDVESTTKALYPPRMTTAQKNAIAGPQPGAVVYDTNLGALSFYNGSAWISTAPTVSGATYTIGQNALGGKVFWLDETGQHGLIVSSTDQTSAFWYNGETNTKANRIGVYGGDFNTNQIITGLGYGNYAASYAATFSGGLYGDWYLPSQGELVLLANSGLGLLSAGNYWSSTEVTAATGFIATQAVIVSNTGVAANNSKSIINKVRAIRKF